MKKTSFADKLKHRAREMKQNLGAAALCLKDPRVPLAPKIILAVTVAYALSPIDLIPDFIPFLGQLDDLILVPLGIALAVRLVPPKVFKDNLAKAKKRPFQLRKNWIAAAVIILIWAVVLYAVISAIVGAFSGGKSVAPPVSNFFA